MNDPVSADDDRPAKASFEAPPAHQVIPAEKTGNKSALREMSAITGVLASALALAFLLITFVFQSYQVSGPSMQPTLQNDDHLIVWKMPKTVGSLTHHPYIPNRGDVIILNEAEDGGMPTQLVKRVVALPGERITVHDGVVTVYNKEHPKGFSPDKTLPYGSVIKSTPDDKDVTLGKNEVYVLGDHRDNSKDSRFFGPVGSNQIVGKLVVRVLPLDQFKLF